MILFSIQGRGFWVPIIAALAMFAPIIILRQVDGEAVDSGVTISMTIAAIVTFGLGFWFNRTTPKGEPAQHAFCRIPFQYWAVPMAIFAALLGFGVLNTAEEPAAPQASVISLTQNAFS